MSLSWRETWHGGPAPLRGRTPLGAALLLAGWMLLAAACSGNGNSEGNGQGELREIRDERHRIENPSKTRALATGIGCGAVRDDAMSSARRVALFNLRSLTGEARYTVEFELLREVERPGQICFEVSARAMPGAE